MIIHLKHKHSESEVRELLHKLDSLQTIYKVIPGKDVIVLPKLNDTAFLKNIGCIDHITETDTPYQLASLKYKKQTSFPVKGIEISNTGFSMMAGPCSVESEQQIEETAAFLSNLGVKFIRGGAYKPRTSPYSFRGLGVEGLKLIKNAAQKHDLRVVTEILDLSYLEEVAEHADILQVGSRNMQNFSLLDELGKINKPILLKRGMLARVTEWLLAAEYILSGGNDQVILCERGIRSFDPASRNVMDIGVIPLIKELSHLPVIADPSHGTGQSSRVTSMAMASVAAGANGLLIEIHPNPAKALSDAQQALSFPEFENLFNRVNHLQQHLALSQADQHQILKLQSL